MSILVTGGAGYIGAHMVLELIAAGERPIVIDDLSTGFRDAVPADVVFYEGDVSDANLVEHIIATNGVTAIAHFAAKTVVPDSVSDPLGYYLANTMKSRALIATAVDCGVKHFIFSSTAAVYGDVKPEPVSEMQLPSPVSPYGRSKLMTEWMLEDTANAHDFNYVALRYFNVAGADPQGRCGQSTARATHLIKTAVASALGSNGGLKIYGTDYDTPDGTCLRDYIQVTDLARAHIAALNYLRNGGTSKVYNCGYGHGISVREIADVVRRVSGAEFQVQLADRRPGDPASVIACADKIRRELGWQPKYDNIEAIVKQALDWERNIAALRAA
jgi:UDP-glucose 4-epimerase